VAELADARDLKSRGRKAVWVRSPPPAQLPAEFVRSPYDSTDISRASAAVMDRYIRHEIDAGDCHECPP
jgi:hypothetical protein